MKSLRGYIYRHLLFLYVVGILVMVTVILGSGLQYLSDTRKFSKNIARLMVMELDRKLERPLNAMKSLDPLLGRKKDVLRQIMFFQQTHPEIKQVMVLSEEGMIREAYPDSELLKGMDYSRSGFFFSVKDQNKPVMTQVETDMRETGPSVAWALPLTSSKGYLLGFMDLRHFLQDPQALRFDSGFAAVIDQYGTFLMHPDRKKVEERQHPDFLSPEWIPGKTNLVGISRRADGTNWLITAYPDYERKWTILVFQDRDRLLGGFYQLVFWVVLTMVLVGLVTWLQFLRFGQSLRASTLKLSGRIEALKNRFYPDLKGDQDFSEFEKIFEAFQEMSVSIRDREEEIMRLNKGLAVMVDQAILEMREKDRMMLLQSRQAAMGEMISNIAHQWRQPLNGLGILIQNLRTYYDFDKLDEGHLAMTEEKAMALIQ